MYTLEPNQPVFPSRRGPSSQKKQLGIESNTSKIEIIAKKKREGSGKSWGKEQENQEILESNTMLKQ